MDEVVRYDVGVVKGIVDLPNGGVRVQSALTRSGVYEYSDGQKTWKEYLPPEEAFAKDSLDTLRGATITDLHPPELVDGRNWRDLTMGHVGDDVHPSGKLVIASLNVFDSAQVQRIKAKERKETSCGYKCKIDPTPGVTPDGVHYDAIQRQRRYNHVGLGPEGWGRAGPEVSLRLDGAAYQVTSEGVAASIATRDVPVGGAAVGAATRSDSSSEKPPMIVFKYKGKTYRADSAEEMASAEKDVVDSEADLNNKIAQLSKQLTEAQITTATISAQLQVKKATEEASKPPPSEEEEVALDARAEERRKLKEAAAPILGDEVKLDGLSSAAIRKAVVAKTMPEGYRLDGLASETLTQMFEVIMAKHAEQAERGDAVYEFAQDLQLPPVQRNTSRRDNKDPPPETARNDANPAARAAQRTADRWRQPCTHTVKA